MLVYDLYRRMPPRLRQTAKRMLGATGHGASRLDALKAKKDAQGKKRLDRALAHLVSTLGLEAAGSIHGKTCIDFGAGYVPTDSVAMWLLGAREVSAVDYNAIWSRDSVLLAIREADPKSLRQTLSAASLLSAAEPRLDLLERIGRGEEPLDRLPISYIAPLDVVAEPERLPEYDLLWSTSVLEHIPPSLIADLLRSISARQRAAGRQVHYVDLRDHLDFDAAPYRFLDPSVPFAPDAMADERGNGMTAETWSCTLNEIADIGLAVVDTVPGRPQLVPANARGLSTATAVADFAIVSTIGS